MQQSLYCISGWSYSYMCSRTAGWAPAQLGSVTEKTVCCTTQLMKECNWAEAPLHAGHQPEKKTRFAQEPPTTCSRRSAASSAACVDNSSQIITVCEPARVPPARPRSAVCPNGQACTSACIRPNFCRCRHFFLYVTGAGTSSHSMSKSAEQCKAVQPTAAAAAGAAASGAAGFAAAAAAAAGPTAASGSATAVTGSAAAPAYLPPHSCVSCGLAARAPSPGAGSHLVHVLGEHHVEETARGVCDSSRQLWVVLLRGSLHVGQEPSAQAGGAGTCLGAHTCGRAQL